MPAIDPTVALWIKALILAIFFGVPLGILSLFRASEDEDEFLRPWWVKTFFGAIFGAFYGLLVVGLCAGVYYGARFLVFG